MCAKPFACLFLLLLVPGLLFAGTTGKISGTVIDNETKDPLIGANVAIEGTAYGAATDINGDYTILNVPAGVYTVKATFIGYAPVTITNARVNSDLTTTLDFGLSSEAVTLEGVEIVAERRLINKDYTNTLTIKSAEDINNLPIRGVTDVVGLEASIVQDEGSNLLYVRGGRPEEVAYFVDGVPVNNPLSGTASDAFSNINQNNVEELQIQTGGFNAEYGAAMSGVIQLNTKRGTSTYTGSAEVVTDAFLSSDVGDDNGWGYHLYNLSVGGPIVPDDDIATLYLSAERQVLDDNDPRAVGGVKPNSGTKSWNLGGKLLFRPIEEANLQVGANSLTWKGNNWNNHHRFRNPEHQRKFDNSVFSGYARFTHNVGSNLFYTLQGSYFNEKLKEGDGVWFDQFTTEVFDSSLGRLRTAFTYGDTLVNPAFPSQATNPPAVFSTIAAPGMVDDRFSKSQSQIYTYSGDVSLQQGSHLFKAGGEIRLYSIRWYTGNPMGLANNLKGSGADGTWQQYRNQNFEYYGYNFDGTEYDGEDDFFNATDAGRKEAPKDPLYYAAYLQDKIELDDLVLNLGFRVDHFDAREQVPKDRLNPFGPRNLPDGSPNPTGGIFDPSDLRESKATTKVSPRLGFSFPITDRAIFHAQYGTFLQMPPLEFVLISKTWEDRYIGDAPFSDRIPNPDLKPERTVSYELGFKQLITDDAALSVTGFYKEVKDLIQARQVGTDDAPAFPNGYETYENADFGVVKGFDIIFELRRIRNLSVVLNYTLSFANGTGTAPFEQSRISWIQTENPKIVAPLKFDRRHRGSLNIDYRTPAEDGPMIGGFYPLERTGLNLLFTFNSGVPYTRSVITNPFFGGVTEVLPTGAVNQATGPWSFRFDLRVDRAFTVGPLDFIASLSVINLLDADNVVSVYEERRGRDRLENEVGIYRGTGEPDNSGWLTTPEGQSWIASHPVEDVNGNGIGDREEAVAVFKAKENNPENFGVPRQIRFGLRLEL